MIQRQIRSGSVVLHEDGLVETIQTPGWAIELQDVQERLAVYRELGGGRPVYGLSELRMTGLSSEARRFVATPEYAEALAGGAVYTDSLVARMLAAVFLAVNPPKFPVRLFAGREEALAWLRRLRGETSGGE